MTTAQPDCSAIGPDSAPSTSPETWYHGSPLRLDVLLSGSTVTRQRPLAEAFASKPTLLCLEDDGSLRHNGQQSGWLYRLTGPLGPTDLVPHPRSSMPVGFEWLTSRALPLTCLTPITPRPDEQLDEQQVATLLAQSEPSGDGA